MVNLCYVYFSTISFFQCRIILKRILGSLSQNMHRTVLEIHRIFHLCQFLSYYYCLPPVLRLRSPKLFQSLLLKHVPFTFYWKFTPLMLLLVVQSLSLPHSFQPHASQPTRLLCPWAFPGKNTGVGCHFLTPLLLLALSYVGN